MNDGDEKDTILKIIGSNQEAVEKAEQQGSLEYNKDTIADSNLTTFYLSHALIGSPSSIEELGKNTY